MPPGRIFANTLPYVVIHHGQLLFSAAFDGDLWTWAFWALSAAGDRAKGLGVGSLDAKESYSAVALKIGGFW